MKFFTQIFSHEYFQELISPKLRYVTTNTASYLSSLAGFYDTFCY